jgi:peptidoglycan/LPS O-acetylase OafA/YrhL
LILLILVISLRQLVLFANDHLVTTPFYDQLYNPVLFKAWWREIYIQLYTRGGPIALGIMAAVIYNYHDDALSDFISRHRLAARVIVSIALAIALLSHSIPYHDPTQDYLGTIGATGNYWLLGLHRNVYALCSAVILLFVLRPRPCFGLLYRILTARLLGFIAKISYSAYLFHILLLKPVYNSLGTLLPNQVGEPAWLILGAVITLLITALVCAIIYAVVEKPFIDLTHRRKQQGLT